MQSKKFWSSCLATIIFWGGATVAQAEIGFRQVSTGESQGIGGKDVPTLDVSPLWGLTLSFIKTNEVVQQVRIGDPSRVVVDFDTPLSGGVSTETRQSGAANTAVRSGAAVIYLRQIGDPLKLPTRLTASAKKSSKIPLTVITVDRSNQRKLYQFLLVLGKNTKYSTVEVVPDSLMPRTGKPVTPVVTAVNVPEQFAKGLVLAQKKNVVVIGSPLDRRLQVLLGLLQKGETLETAAQQADVPLAVVNQIMQLKP
jgi:hypothetical protein